MKQKLRFLLPHEPLKVLRGEPDEEDEQDELFRRFQPPPGTTTEEEQDDDNTDSDNDEDGFPTDVTDNHMERHAVNDNTSINGLRFANNIQQNANGSVNVECQIHQAPNFVLTHNDDDALQSNETDKLLSNMQGETENREV